MRPVFTVLSPGGSRARLSVLVFHRVLREPDPIFPGEVDERTFDAVCVWLRTWFNVLALDVAATRLADASLPPRAAAITFDDGYADNHDVALPILRKHGLPATFFIASGFVDGGWMWNDGVIEAVRHCRGDALSTRGIAELGVEQLQVQTLETKREAIALVLGAIKYLPVDRRLEIVRALQDNAGVQPPTDFMMTSHQLRELSRAGMQIGAHTVSHPILSRLDSDATRAEVIRGRDFLESTLQQRVGLFAYPNGQPGTDYSKETVQVVREAGFDAAFTTAWGAASRESDHLQLPRFTPWDRTRRRFGWRLAGNLLRSPRLA